MRAVFFLFFAILSFFAAGQSDDRVKLRDLQAATGDGQVIQSLNDTSRWVVPPWADSISVLQDSIVVLYSDGSEVARDTVGPFGGATTIHYQTLRDDGTPLTQRDAINFVATSTVATTLTDDAGNGETEVALSVIPGGVDHGGLAGLADDDHTQYALLAGRASGQTLTGGTGTTDDLIFKTTSGVGATGAEMQFNVGNNGATRVVTILNNGNFGLGINNPLVKFDVQTTNQDALRFQTTGASSLGFLAINTDGRSALFQGKSYLLGGVMSVRGLTGNTGDILQVQNSSGTTLSKFDVNGSLGVNVQTSSTLSQSFRVVGSGATSATVNTLLENSSGTDLLYLDNSGQLGLLTNLPARTLHVAGEARITDLTTDTPTRIVGADADGDLGAITVGSGLTLSAGTLTADAAAIDHGGLSGLADDDHTQYLLLAGRATGQVATGGTASGDDLTLRSTTNATKGDIIVQDQGGNMILGGAATASRLRMLEASGSGTNYTEFVTQAQAANVTYTLPADDGDAGEQLQTNGSGSLSWQPPGGDIDFEVYDVAGSYTYNIPTGAKAIDIITIGGGGGGGSGRKGATTDANTGGGGGGGGGYSRVLFVVSELSASSLDIDVGAGGTGGASVSTSSTNGSGGADGEITTVYCSGFLLCAGGPGDGGGGGSTGASTGGVDATIGDVLGQNGGSCATDGVAAAGDASNNKAPGGGGSGGGIPAGGTPAKNGSRSAKYNYGQDQITNNGTVASPDAGDATANAQQITGGGGGAGGASSIASSGGDGGDGIMGSGGGGGGAALNGVGDSGAGGAGGTGWVLLIVKY